ncbi:MAG: ABC transporter substrate-binding protein [Acidimicrobiales bacterium]
MSREIWGDAMHKTARSAVLALAVAVAGGACGSDADDSAGQTTAAPAAQPGAAPASGAAVNLPNTVAGADPAAWKTEGKKVTGPSGFTLDLSKCPANWKDTAGITDTEIRLAASTALSGPVAPYGQIQAGEKVYFDYINATEGGIGGKKITFAYKDDGYEAARGKANIDELVETGNVFAFNSVLGTPIVMATYDKMNEACIPNLSSATGHPAWGDPVNHPWTTGLQLAYNTEAIQWGQYLLDAYGKGTTVAALVANNDFGILYKDTFEKFAKANGMSLVKYETFEPLATTVTNELTNLASSNADVMIIMAGNIACPQTFTYLAGSSWKPKEKIVSSTCANVNTFFKPAGQAANGWMLTGGTKDLADAAWKDDATVKQVKEIMGKAGLDTNNNFYGTALQFAWPIVENMKRAAQLPGGLTRTNLMLAARSLSAQNPWYVDGIKSEMNGAKDAFMIEATQLQRYKVDPGQEVGSLVPFGKIIDLNGKTPPCVWDGKACRDS